MIPYPNIPPVLWDTGLGPLKVRFYGLMYVIGFSLGWLLLIYRVKRMQLSWDLQQISDLVFYAMLGVLLGGRLGYFLFYWPQRFFQNPLSLFKVWEGGMSFHGGLLGVALALWVYGCRYRRPFFELTDLVIPVVPLGLAAGRLGNFVNGELWGRVTDVPWAMVFPRAGPLARHPSQLYECLLEGVLLFIIVWFYSKKNRPLGAVSACFLVVYALCRLFVELFRQPDWQIGFLMESWLTMGQFLSLPMLVIGVWWWCKALRHPKL